MDTPEEVVGKLIRCRRLERRDVAALRIDTGEDVTDRAVLAGGVEALEDQQDALLSFCVEPLLERAQLIGQRGEPSLALVFPGEAEHVARISTAEIGRGAGSDDQRVKHSGSLRRTA